jgi:hypothetical protein
MRGLLFDLRRQKEGAMRTTGSMLLLALIVVFASAIPAAAVVTVNVLTDTGDPLPNATVKLETGETATTDQQGTATFTGMRPGTHTATVTSTETTRRKTTFVVPESGTTSVNIPVERVYPWMIQDPPFGAFGVGPRFYGLRLNDMRLTRDLLRDRTQGGTFVNRSDARNLRDFNRTTDNSLDIEEYSLDGAFGLPSFKVFDRLGFYPGLSLAFGEAHVNIKERDSTDARNTTKLDGTGYSYGGGFEVGMRILSSHRDHMPLLQDMYARAGYSFFGGHVGLDRSPRGSGRTGSLGATILDESGSLDWRTHSFYTHLGRTFLNDMVFPYVGVRYTSTSLSLATDSNVTVPIVGPVTREIRQDFRRDDVQGVIGLDARPFGRLHRALSPLFTRAEIDINGSSLAMTFKLMYQFGGVDP